VTTSQHATLTAPPEQIEASESPSTQSVVKSHCSYISYATDQTLRQETLIPSRFFRASVFAAHIPFVSAGSGEDFSNNLLSDLAPLLALFGDQFAKQFMSQSMSLTENVIFACAPLGILTAVVGAIRVGGPTSMKAIIGRTTEPKGMVEMELLSSTSSDVCELWDGEGFVRVMGASPVIELFYLEPKDDTDRSLSQDLDGTSDNKIFSFESARNKNLLEPRPTSQSEGARANDCETFLQTAPNIALNVCGQRVSKLELKVVALIGILLQLGVIVFAGLSVQKSPVPWNGKFKKDGRPAQAYSFPLMAFGTMALVFGMFICACIVERSSTEMTWNIKEPSGTLVKVAWLQRGGVVNDQQFNSYFIQRSDQIPGIIPRILGLGCKKYPRLHPILQQLLSIDDRPNLRTSSRGTNGRQQASLTIVATIISLCGFVSQFVGLRGLHWSITIAQLVATAIMTALRATVRRNFVKEVCHQKIEPGNELDAASRRIIGCDHWSVVTNAFSNEKVTSNGLAMKVMDARCRLGALSQWEFRWQKTVDSTTEAIEAVMNFICTNADVNLKASLEESFKWKLVVEVSEDPLRTISHFEFIQLGLSRKWLSEGRGWGPWKAVKSEIEAVLGLWMLHFKELEAKSKQAPQIQGGNSGEDEPVLLGAEILRIVDCDGLSESKVYDQWIRRNTENISVRSLERVNSGPVRYRHIVGKSSNAISLLAVVSDAPLETVCGQIILSEFISRVVGEVVESIGGHVRVRGGETGVKASFGLRNTVLDQLAERVERTNLATAEEAYMSIVPAFRVSGKLPINDSSTEVFSDTAKEATMYLKNRRYEQAELLFFWLLDIAESSATAFEVHNRWDEACEVYSRLCGTFDDIKNGREYASKAEDAMGSFCERMFTSFSVDVERVGEVTPQTILNSVRAMIGDMLGSEAVQVHGVWDRRLQKWEKGLATWKTDGGDTQHMSNSESLRKKAADGNCLSMTRLFKSARKGSIDVNARDSLDRTPLILASISGHETVIAQLLKNKADLLYTDYYGRTALHYASMGGHASVVRVLSLHNQSGKIIDSPDINGKSSLDLAVDNYAGAVVALLIFYGAKDLRGNAKKLLDLSIHKGSFAAVAAMLDTADDVNLRDSEYGRTPLHWAVWRDSLQASKLLLSQEAEVGAKDKRGYTALHYAARNCRIDMIQLLLGQGANINAQADDGSTPLHFAATGGHDATARLLVENFGADTEANDSKGRTVLHYAAKNCLLETVELLLNRSLVSSKSRILHQGMTVSILQSNLCKANMPEHSP